MRLAGVPAGGGWSEYCLTPFSSSQTCWASAGRAANASRQASLRNVVAAMVRPLISDQRQRFPHALPDVSTESAFL
jgi:hypothetical protein